MLLLPYRTQSLFTEFGFCNSVTVNETFWVEVVLVEYERHKLNSHTTSIISSAAETDIYIDPRHAIKNEPQINRL